MNWLNQLIKGASEKSRLKKSELFLEMLNPSLLDRILDVGVAIDEMSYSDNLFEKLYPYPHNVVAVSISFPAGGWNYSNMPFVQADGRYLPFRDQCFDIVYSNAVVEHVGETQDQRLFIHELLRVARRAFITTPNRWFPLEVHTRLPLLSWLPRPLFKHSMRALGHGSYLLNPLDERAFKGLFPDGSMVQIIKQGSVWFLPEMLIAVVRK